MNTTKTLLGILAATASLGIGLPALASRTATAVAVIGDGRVQAITLTDAGDGYDDRPLIEITGGGGTGAKATALSHDQSGNHYPISGIYVDAGGSGYANPPVVQIESPEQAHARTQAEAEKTKAQDRALMEAKAKADEQAKAKAQAFTERMTMLKKLPAQVSEIAIVGFLAVWIFVFAKSLSGSRQSVSQIDLAPIFKKFLKPLLVSGLVSGVAIVAFTKTVNGYCSGREFYEAVETISTEDVNADADDSQKAGAYHWCLHELSKKYEKYDIVATNWVHGSFVTGKNMQDEMDKATRAAIAIDATKGTHTEMLRDAIMASANDPRRTVEIVHCEIQITHRINR